MVNGYGMELNRFQTPPIPPLPPSTPLPMASTPNLPIIISSNAPKKAYLFMWMKEVSAKKYTITFSIFTALIMIATVISIYGHAVRNDWPTCLYQSGDNYALFVAIFFLGREG
jgi:hypothetical protein